MLELDCRRRSWRALRRSSLVGSLIAALVLPLASYAKDYPVRPIHLVVPYPPGGVADIVARPIAEKLSRSLGQPVVVENRGGAVGTIGAAYVAHAPADGYTLLLGTSNEITMVPSIYPSVTYDPRTAFAPITPVVLFPNVLIVNSKSPAKSVADLVAMARVKPGAITFSSSGVGSSPQLSETLFEERAGVKLLDVPYRGGGPSVEAVYAGHVTASFATLPSAIALIKSGRLRALAVTGETRSPALPNVPTLSEAGLSRIVVVTWNGVLAPAGTPPAIVNQLNKAIVQAVDDPKLKQTLISLGAEVDVSAPDVFLATVRKDYDSWSKVIKGAGISMK